MPETQNNADTTCLVLLLLFLVLLLLLVYLYRRLNRDTDGEYTIRKLVLDEGGLRDRVRSGVVAVETRLGIHLWPRPRPDREDEEEVMVEGQRAKNRDVESGPSPSDKCGEGAGAQGEGEHDGEGDDSEDDYSSMGGTDLRERANLMKDVEDEDNHQEGQRRKGGGEEEEEEEEEREEGKPESLGLLVNLQELSGSAIWSEEKKDETEDIDLTAL